ncbi:helix-turn-helix domain-containing protein [Ralstonia solanacearum]|uniref:Transcriptional regulator n=1 Tax=Ralstonia solanacearum K60 TaxID=1091042 RepID=A0AAP8D4E4_RALSL|nr:helix-turn-helix domain-containing protein [Ralstonia solanacearum]MBT1536629.1 helix-turn-helix domain-containing protein [Ralstonia solanacearum]OYQ13641.1 transcriptional regulator [Ralstonia solanacearum K60]QOK83686.1 XRE family transcriptional regulator [Ralstonia solanacearum]RIJ86699.1 helix-turn-helix domain-containing protein [Ralstonia solanacearum]CCF97907.1 putative transcription regulator protein (modular protein) [Ralstonia solanacearum K60]
MQETTAPPGDDTDAGVNERIARRVRELRAARGYTLDALAARCGVSRSMISLIERSAASPTAAVLDKLAAGLGVSLASLFGGEREGVPAQPLMRRAQQTQWRDPESGYVRRNLSPPDWPSPIHLVEVHFPAGARVAYETGGRERVMQQQVWVIEGRIDIMLGNQLHELHQGDCLAMRLDQPLIFSNPTSRAAHYVVAICDAPAPAGAWSP